MSTFAVPFGNERDFYGQKATKKFIEKTERKYKQVPRNCNITIYFKRASVS